MKGELKLFVIIIFLTLCAALLALIVFPLPYEGLDWVSLGRAIAAYGTQQADKGSSPPVDAVNPGQAAVIHDPETPSIAIFFPASALSEPIEARVYYTALPDDIPHLPNGINTFFYFGAWIKGAGITVEKFHAAIGLTVPYDEGKFRAITQIVPPFLAHAPGSRLHYSTPEEKLRLYMYDPSTKNWTKLCGWVDPHANTISGLLLDTAAFKEGANTGNTLFAIGIDETVRAKAERDPTNGTTMLAFSDPYSNLDLSLDVPPGAVEDKAFFEITFSDTIPDGGSMTLLSRFVDIKTCMIDYEDPQNSQQITSFKKSVTVSFGFPDDVAGSGNGDLTIAILEDDEWRDFANRYELPVIDPSGNMISIDAKIPGTFSLAARSR